MTAALFPQFQPFSTFFPLSRFAFSRVNLKTEGTISSSCSTNHKLRAEHRCFLFMCLPVCQFASAVAQCRNAPPPRPSHRLPLPQPLEEAIQAALGCVTRHAGHYVAVLLAGIVQLREELAELEGRRASVPPQAEATARHLQVSLGAGGGGWPHPDVGRVGGMGGRSWVLWSACKQAGIHPLRIGTPLNSAWPKIGPSDTKIILGSILSFFEKEC